jgi:hypothetical protein
MRHLIPFAALLALTACGSKDETTTVTTADGEEIKITSDTDNNSESGTITFEGKDGEGKITFGDAASGQKLPLDMPVYPGGEVKGTFTGGDGKGEQGGMATVMTKDPAAKVIDYYKAEAAKRGYAIKTTSSANDMASFSAEGKGGETLVITASPSEGEGTAAVIMGGAKN